MAASSVFTEMVLAGLTCAILCYIWGHLIYYYGP